MLSATESQIKQADASSNWIGGIPAGPWPAVGVPYFVVSHRRVCCQLPAGIGQNCWEDNSLVSAYILSLILARSLRRHVIHLLLQCNYRGIAIQELSLKAFLCAIKCNDNQISGTSLQKVQGKLFGTICQESTLYQDVQSYLHFKWVDCTKGLLLVIGYFEILENSTMMLQGWLSIWLTMCRFRCRTLLLPDSRAS